MSRPDSQAQERPPSSTVLVLRDLPSFGERDTRCPPMRDNIRLVSSAGTGFTYYTTKNKRTTTGKLEFKKYDPVVRKHVVFKETKMPPHSK